MIESLSWLQVGVSQEDLDDARQIFAPPSSHVFLLVPEDFDTLCSEEYNAIGRPPVSRRTVWNVYLHLRRRIDERLAADPMQRGNILDQYEQSVVEHELEDVAEPLAGLQPLAEVDGYLGGVNGGAGLGECATCFSYVPLTAHQMTNMLNTFKR